MTEAPLLSVRGLSRSFGGLAAVQDVSLDLRRGVVTALAGPNGAGKTTLFNLITGHIAADAGAVDLMGASILGRRPHHIARAGIARSFQDLRLFGSMTVRDNVLAALEPVAWLWQPGEAAARRERVEQALVTTDLIAVADTRAVDEPASGLDPASRQRFVRIVRDGVASGVTVCLIEHNLDIMTELADRIAFLDRGRKLAEGEPEEILSDAELIAIYFGERKA